uniref:Carboxylesterase type B domain-containing protein n=1 Tax=Timema poppense TaxID=170557 RepID=A0A7R9HFZ9_TIMPO|nr:unnamed protein product [Timema poppensis]
MCAAKQDLVTVTVKQGSLRGRKVISRPGSTYYSFQGVPYARPPVGYRRFKFFSVVSSHWACKSVP